jgi:GNAT superfamily N-acetyltransferase
VTFVPEIRAALPDDIAAIRSILAGHGNDGPVVTVDIVGPYVAHLVRHHRAMLSVAGGEVVAFGAVVDAGVSTHLADLFVRTGLMGRGIGRPLLAALFADATRRTTFASDDPRALPLYVRAGMTPLWASLYLEGAGAVLPAPAGSIDVERAIPAELARLELEWTGVDRSVDHEFWGSQGEAESAVVAVGGEPAATLHARTRQATRVRVVDRLLVRPGIDPVAPTLAALRMAARGGSIQCAVQGPSPVLRVLLDLGFLIHDRDQYMASEAGLVDPARLLPNPGML